MSEPFLAEIKIVSFPFPPKGWALCNGQLLPINQNQALFSLLGTMYGGDGMRTFGLPNLQGRVPNHMGPGFTLGQVGGETAHTLSIAEMPQHNHVPVGSNAGASSPTAEGNLWAKTGAKIFNPSSNGAMNPACIGVAGGSQAHNNMSPYLVLNFIIALQGIFPSQT
ncbi:MAG TPA: tail fiber protein [Candidatus Angelobacter sp.]|nr:tail fiber protein [Candidatus Angelobacter sp.]